MHACMYTGLYWNLQWYTTLWKLPAGLLCGNLTADLPNIATPIVCGWRRSVVEARAAKILCADKQSEITCMHTCIHTYIHTYKIGLVC